MMDNGQDSELQPRKRRGRPPNPRRASSASADASTTADAPTDALPRPANGSSASSHSDDMHEERQPYQLNGEQLSPFSSFLQSILRQDRAEISRVARELDVAENTIYRWINGSSEPRSVHLRRLPDVLLEHRANLTYVINQTFPGTLDSVSTSIREVSKDIYRAVLDLVSVTAEDDTRFWQASQAIFDAVLTHLDAERRGFAITFARLMPARKDGIHSLRESAMRGNSPWPYDIESKAYLGSTTLAGAAVTLQRMLVWDNVGGGDRLQVEVDEFEESACAAPVMHAGRIAGALIASSTLPSFFEDALACQAIVEYAQLLATALPESDFVPVSMLKLRPMPELSWQREQIAHSYVSRILTYARKYATSRVEAELHVRSEMELEFEDFGRIQADQRISGPHADTVQQFGSSFG